MKELKTVFNTHLDDNIWVRVKNHCRTTDNKGFTENVPSDEFREKLLISEHSPIRILELDWTWGNIPYWVSTEWSRHKFEKFISTQRDDRLKDDMPRGQKPQEAPVNFDGFANMQNLIDAWRKRMCFMATPEARSLALDFRAKLAETHPIEAKMLVPNCIYRCGCPEFRTCGHLERFLRWVDDKNSGCNLCVITDISMRYSLYDEYLEELEA